MSRLRGLVAAGVVVLTIAGCGAGHSPFRVHNGMTMREVRQTAGAPTQITLRKDLGPVPPGVAGRETCWFYPAHKKGTSLQGLAFCFNAHGRVNWTIHDERFLAASRP
jgi:hypothetical protein